MSEITSKNFEKKTIAINDERIIERDVELRNCPRCDNDVIELVEINKGIKYYFNFRCIDCTLYNCPCDDLDEAIGSWNDANEYVINEFWRSHD